MNENEQWKANEESRIIPMKLSGNSNLSDVENGQKWETLEEMQL